jgi:O-antigen ligase
MFLAAVAYGGSDPWWKAFFACAIFAITIFSVLEIILSDNPTFPGLRVLAPAVVLVLFSLAQTIPIWQANPAAAGISYRFWNAISADPYETRIFALQLTALILLAGQFFHYATNERRLRRLIHVLIAIAVVSAVFGLLRQTMQHQATFLLPLLKPEQGYGQFINKNHFAYVMEMGLGLALGLVAAGGVRRQQVLIYLAVLLPIWTALILSNSRGAILAMLVQFVVTLLLFPKVARNSHSLSGKAWDFVRSRSVRLTLVSSLIVLVIFGVFWVGGDRLATSIEAARGEFTESAESREGVTRVKIWRDTLRMFEANPIAGVGMGGYWVAIPTFHDAPGSMTPQQAHNDYLEILASGGLVGLAIFIWFVVVGVKSVRVNLQSADPFRRAACFAALIAIAGVAVHSLFDFGLHRMLNAMMFTALIVIATGVVRRDPSLLEQHAYSSNGTS